MYGFILIGGLSAWYMLISKFCHKRPNTFIPCAKILQNVKLPENMESNDTCVSSKGVIYDQDNDTVMWYSLPNRGLRSFIGDILNGLNRKERKEALRYLRRLKSVVHHTENYDTIEVPHIINYFCHYL